MSFHALGHRNCCVLLQILWRLKQEMPRKDLTIAEKIVLLRRIKEQPPNSSHRQLAEITGVPRTTLARILQDCLFVYCR